MNRKYELNKTKVNPFFIAARVITKSGLAYDIIVNTNGEDGRWQGEIRPVPDESCNIFVMSLVRNNQEMSHKMDAYMFLNKEEKAWFDVAAGTGGENWTGLTDFGMINYGTAMLKVYWETHGAPPNSWMLYCPLAPTLHKEVYETKRHVAGRPPIFQTSTDDPKGKKVFWQARTFDNEAYARIVKMKDPTMGWSLIWKSEPNNGGVATVSSQGKEDSDEALWQIWRLRGDIKTALNFTQEDWY
eukprot:GHVN01026261.1.p1 GENE.GHVN01026261.1~~GHVN01026261.1.p1  ORF type:complete len:275 (+),score=40.16 GHVN01026261.1:99-827(+)